VLGVDADAVVSLALTCDDFRPEDLRRDCAVIGWDASSDISSEFVPGGEGCRLRLADARRLSTRSSELDAIFAGVLLFPFDLRLCRFGCSTCGSTTDGVSVTFDFFALLAGLDSSSAVTSI